MCTLKPSKDFKIRLNQMCMFRTTRSFSKSLSDLLQEYGAKGRSNCFLILAISQKIPKSPLISQKNYLLVNSYQSHAILIFISFFTLLKFKLVYKFIRKFKTVLFTSV